MKLSHYAEAAAKVFDGGPAKGVVGRVVIGKDDGAEHFCMRVFELSPGGYTPRHQHRWEHEIFVHSGSGVVFHQEQWMGIEPGNVIFIPGEEEHQLKNTGTESLVFVCLIPSGVAEL